MRRLDSLPSLDTLSTWAVVLAALSIAGAALHREFSAAEPSAAASEATFVDDWESILAVGIRFGDSTAPVKLVEFADLECPFCASIHEPLSELRRRRSKDIEYIFVHSPLPQHQFALPAARALECATKQHRGVEMMSALFAKQDSFGLRSWSAYSQESDVASTAQFEDCMAAPTGFERIDAGLAVAERVRIPGTPSFLINGWLHTGVLPDSLDALVTLQLEQAEKR